MEINDAIARIETRVILLFFMVFPFNASCPQ
jgi:hypothetical protein